jgi:anti-sigma regulatory factor (Ser/Thr protein kinase)
MTTLLTLVLPARLEHLGTFIAAVTEVAQAKGAGAKTVYNIELACEEALVNIINYAYPEATGNIELTCKHEGESLLIEIVDTGMPFDVLSLTAPDTAAGIEERGIGGLGIYFMKKLMDEVTYRREGDKNILEMKVRLAA